MLLRAVCESPDDDTPRLVFADWLDEHGDPERAEFIRVQVEIARGECDLLTKEREQDLLKTHRENWEPPYRDILVEDADRAIVYGVHFRRGFPWALSVNDENAWFVDYASTLFRFAPIERVNLFHKSQHEDLSRCSELLRVKELLLDRGEGFEAEQLRALLRSKYLTNLTRLDLIADDDNGHLELDGLEVLGQAMNLPSLRYLDLSYNCSWMLSEERQNWIRRFTKGRLIGQLETLRLRSTDVTDECARILARCKRAGSLRHLDVSGNSIGAAGLRALATSSTLSSLAVLDLRGNSFEDESGAELQECPPKLRRLLEDRFGSGLLLDGKPDPHPIDEWFKQCK
ncbi:repeat-companion domain-containing protein : Repeat-companion domain protein OS=Isosphaera pallida (strain ATCC 43644 / DSM 9630 / IS1B) GN=Isop_0392 PE=4 SV=1: LRR_7: LRR_6 [Gemmataceae bacterium]|nr:repeat-companion domain-containing protein : Repeat-companion domain protein OS=Isosphaera pallida (strain ATCC 43644 / DSM 9630 / IS1B) GN=Isop_0392 PE=4 SV=1: LRR_7: LRR_6 [Gemmataceae bacterium]VTT97390.1 repeat-companion domain-containing protein : Repeat-companion domain protein OS=Isosphaera pallida (strain ATCC 43644 / DSM 9630 / IS1B) GN=Isop_0392 PE=4 SV=1: LRR_7: LRR_6 [Gemmataceae bacterium]